MAEIAQIWRHPIKGIGAEPLDSALLSADRPLPGDRAWAMLTGDARDTGAWQRCNTFARGCNGPQLMAITAKTEGEVIHLDHPTAGPLAVTPATDGQALIDWLTPLWPAERPALSGLIAAPPEGMSDASYACVSILGTASLKALSQACGTALDPRRFRGNIWLDGLTPWQELDWPGQRLQIGDVVFEVVEKIDRCRATETNPETGARDVNTLQVLRKAFGHIDFGVKARVVTGGSIALGQKAVLL